MRRVASILVILSFISLRANAYDEVLAFRLSLTGDVLAVVSGTSDSCDAYFRKAAEITRAGAAISIVSNANNGACFIPLPPSPYEVIANLGPLAVGQYDVNWRQATASVSATLDTRALILPLVSTIYGTGQQIVVAGSALSNPFVVQVLDAQGHPVAGVPVVIGPAVGAESGVLQDEFGFRGFNASAVLSTWGALLPTYSVRTNDYGIAFGQGPLFDLASSSSLYGAKVQLPSPQDLQTYFSVVTLANRPQPDAASVVVEYFNQAIGHYFITNDSNEIAALDQGRIKGWARSIGSFAAFPAGAPRTTTTVPVCRFFSSKVNSHFFTANPAECDAVIAKWPEVWTLETRAAFWIDVPDPSTGECSPLTQPVYRLYNNRSDANHRFVTDRLLRDTMVSRGWVSEGLGPYGVVMCALR